MPEIHYLQLLKCEYFIVIFIFYHKKIYFLVLDSKSDKTSNLNKSLWALGDCDECVIISSLFSYI